MRVLIVTLPGRPHLYPLVPLAWACRAAGHDVRIAGTCAVTDDIVHTGLPAVVAVADTMMDDLVAFAWAWEPDMVVYGSAGHAGAITAGALGVPAVRHLFGRDKPCRSLEHGQLFERFGVEPSFQPARTLDPTPPSMRTNQIRSARISMRHVPYHGAGSVPRWLVEPRERPRICVTDANIGAVNAFAESDVDIIVLGPTTQIAGLGRLPDTARAAGCTPLQLVLPHCDLVVQQGDDGTTLTAAVLGVPQLVITKGSGSNGVRVAVSGAGIHLSQDGPAALRAALTELLADPKYRIAARRLRAEIESQPTPAEVVAELEALECED